MTSRKTSTFTGGDFIVLLPLLLAIVSAAASFAGS